MMIKPFFAFMLMFPPCFAFSVENPTLPWPEVGFEVGNVVSIKVPDVSMLSKLENKSSASGGSGSGNFKPPPDKQKRNTASNADNGSYDWSFYFILLFSVFSWFACGAFEPIIKKDAQRKAKGRAFHAR